MIAVFLDVLWNLTLGVAADRENAVVLVFNVRIQRRITQISLTTAAQIVSLARR